MALVVAASPGHGLVFAGRAALEIGRFEIDRLMHLAEGLSRPTAAPRARASR